MSLFLDHIVIAVHDLEAAIDDYAALGFHVLRGGEHPGRPTHNALVVFADGSYFELIAWREPAPADRWWQLLQRRGEGIVDFALLPADTAATVAAAAGRGLRLEGPLDGGRLRPDGERLRWQTARPATPDLPFLCGDITPRALRVPEGDARRHPNGATGVASLALTVHDLDATLARYRALLGPAAAGVGRAVTLGGGRGRLALIALAETSLLLWAPDAQRSSDAGEAEEGAHGDPLQQRLAVRGEGPHAVVLRTRGDASARTPALTLTHGASIEFEQEAA
ncbi:VOC family protein [Variovorax sp. J22P271]|uniref:VOC family protein n=1 Tax=Variovorax davisae TaxID=3053515 RepID=UPI002575C57F|nr:VOC family protein [Variovorax sp. J22P271]MDM0035673.1 VOC family protein [Variovorax sp. J22P271]